MRIDLRNPDVGTLRDAAQTVRRGGIALYPTDTIYGLGCDAYQTESLRRLLLLKGRSREKGMLVLIRSLPQLEELARSVPPEAGPLLRRFWPGPLTVLLEAHPRIPTELQGEGGKVGIRWPSSSFLQTWLDLLQVPLVSTSANRSGQEYDGSPAVLRRLFGAGVDLFIDGGTLLPSRPSTVLDLTTRPFRIVRPGERESEIARCLSE